MTILYNRVIDNIIPKRFSETPVLLLQGPRSVGKSTTLKIISQKYNKNVLDLDDPETIKLLEIIGSDIIPQNYPVFIDEYQKNSNILNIIKSRLNLKTDYQQFLISGSTSFDAMPSNSQNLTGRIDKIDILPLSQLEISQKRHNNNIEKIINNFPKFLEKKFISKTEYSQYLKMLTIGGFPLSLTQKTISSRNRWFKNYINYTINRDIRDMANIRQTDEMISLLNKLAKASGQILNIKNISKDSKMNESTTKNYITLLEKVFLINRLPISKAINTNKLMKRPKIHFVDTGIASSILGINELNINDFNPKIITNIGGLFESFAINEIIRLASVCDDVKNIGYWRTLDGKEIDLILETWNNKVFAFEIKSGVNIKSSDFNSIKYYKKLAGDSFGGGILFYTGKISGTVEKDIALFPLDTLWH
ncbi:MAG: DUF4143 domain-containing protein [Bifidobacteriaceae bacterium]|jgi:predicted AAA+ superfamily ATPase|nr:DUF4143 domain-containing protein [Bifidobacteriaceae bacterium]